MSERKTAEDWAHDLAHHSGTGPLVFTAHAAKVLTAAMAQEYERGREAMREEAVNAVWIQHAASKGQSDMRGFAVAAIRALPTKPPPEPGQSNPLRDAGFGPELDAIAKENKACRDAPRVMGIDLDGKPVPACPRCGLHHARTPEPARESDVIEDSPDFRPTELRELEQRGYERANRPKTPKPRDP